MDVLVIGGGHAGCEAALAAMRMGSTAVLITHRFDSIGVMSCNPAIGGIGKSHLVREIDALDGLMGRAADAAAIHYRLLNHRKGPAVHGPRAQSDRSLYKAFVRNEVLAAGLRVIEGEVVDLLVAGDVVTGVLLADGAELRARATVLTTGTFLRGVIHVGRSSSSGGRISEPAANRLADRIRDFGFPVGRLKTGTPPRLDGRTIDWSRVTRQESDQNPVYLSFLSDETVNPQIACGVTATNGETHDAVRRGLGDSPLFSGAISGTGPRYCPSIEDKIVRFADRPAHQIFLEPEGLSDPSVYPNGISTSLPAETQEAMVRSIAGLESAKIVKYGYAIEYDYVDPRSLLSSLECRVAPGLFLAGQINGTTGYEEAAAQGLVAGANAAHRTRGEGPIEFARSESYIGVLIDDLVSHGVTEPYRMFTSRSENRLQLRPDNADQRLTPLGREHGLVGDRRWRMFSEVMSFLRIARDRLESISATPDEWAAAGLDIRLDGVRRTAFDVMSRHRVGLERIRSACPELEALEETVGKRLEAEALYAPYIPVAKARCDELRSDLPRLIPIDLEIPANSGLSAEILGKLSRLRPRSLGEAAAIEGMTPAALEILRALVVRSSARAA